MPAMSAPTSRDQAAAAPGERLVVHELVLRRPGRARVTTRLSDAAVAPTIPADVASIR